MAKDAVEDHNLEDQDLFETETEGEESLEGAEGADGSQGGDDGSQQDPEKKRFEYWQSVADKRQARLQELESVAPVANLLKQRPELLDVLEQHLQPKNDAPKRPEPPVRPIGYDPVAAASDPTSESFKYRMQQEEHLQKLVEYNESLIVRQQRALEDEQNRRKQLDSQRELIAKTKLMAAQKGLKGAEIDEFVDIMLSPGKTSFDNLVDLYKVMKTKKKQVPPNTPQKKNQAPPPPLDSGGWDDSAIPPEDKAFGDDLLSRNKRTR